MPIFCACLEFVLPRFCYFLSRFCLYFVNAHILLLSLSISLLSLSLANLFTIFLNCTFSLLSLFKTIGKKCQRRQLKNALQLLHKFGQSEEGSKKKERNNFIVAFSLFGRVIEVAIMISIKVNNMCMYSNIWLKGHTTLNSTFIWKDIFKISCQNVLALKGSLSLSLPLS